MRTLVILAIVMCSFRAFAQDTLVVTKITDPDMFLYNYNYIDSLCDPEMYGTLQWAFRKAADSPAETVYIVFNIPGVGLHVISLNYGLPQLGRTVVIDGASQPGYQPGSPSIIIDGNGNFNVGISLYSADSCVVNGLCLRNFRYNGILCNRVNNSRFTGNVIYNIIRMLYDLLLGEGAIGFLSSSDNLITGNIIGTDNTGSVYNNRYAGINIQKIPSGRIATPPSYGNIIGSTTNNEGNVIANNTYYGILVGQDCYSNRISGNRIYNNNKGITLTQAVFPHTSGNYDKPAPVINSYNGTSVSGISDPNDVIEIFGSTGDENANNYLGSTNTDSTGNWSIQTTTTYPYIIATATDVNNNSSSLSNIINSRLEIVSTPNGIASCGTSAKSILDFNKKYYDYVNNVDTTQSLPKNARNFLSQDQFPSENILLCGDHFRLYYDDFNHSPGGFTDPTLVGSITIGEQRRNTLCAVLEYIESVIEIPAGERIDIFINQSFSNINPISTGSSMLAMGGPYYTANTFGVSQGVYNGNFYDHIKTGIDPDPNNYDALLQVNFDQYWDTYGINHPIEYYDDYQTVNVNNRFDLYSILLHEVTHMLGWVTGISEDLTTSVPYSNPAISINNSFTLYDWNFLFQGDILNIGTLTHLVGGTYLSPVLQINNSVNDPLRQNNIWLNSTGTPTNHPVYSGCHENGWFLNSSSGSLLCHLNYSILSFHGMAQFSPGFQPRYVTGPYFSTEEMRREWTLAEWRALRTLGYTFTNNFLNSSSLNNIDLNSNLLDNTPPFRANNNNAVTSYSTSGSDALFPETQFIHSMFIPNYPSNPSMIIDIPSDPALLSYDNIFDYNGDPISIMPNSLFGIRGVSDGTNSHARLVINGTGTQIEYTPEPGYIGKAQFGFNLWDGHECGSLIIYTIDVQPPINLSIPFGDELVINGGFEDGTEVKQNDGIHFNLPYTSRHDGYEGEYYRGYHLSGAHPFSYLENGFNLYGGTIIENSYKDPFYIASPFHLGGYGWGNSSSNFISGNMPNPLPNPNNPLAPLTNERYEILRAWVNYAFSTLKNNVETYHKYQFKCDLSFCSNIMGSLYTSGQNYSYKIQFTTDPGSDPDNVTVLQENTFSTTVQALNSSINGDLWQPEMGEITYCSTTPTKFFRIISTDGNVFIDNLSLKEIVIPPLTVSINGNTSVCSGATTNLTATPNETICNVTYLWQPGGYTTQTITTPSLTSTTSYSVTITDASGATATDQVTVTVFPAITSSIVSTDASCSGTCDGTATVTPQAGLSPYLYLWNDPANQTTQTATNLCAGNYSVTITDANNCTATNNTTIANTPGPVIALTAITDADPCGCNGSITVSPQPGVTFTWSTVPTQTGETALNLCSGNYTVTASYTNGCTSTQTFTINDVLPPSFLYPCNTTIDISSGTTNISGQTFDFCGHYVVHSGATLIISYSTIRFTPGSDISVLSGGTLKVLNSTLTNYCSGEMWNGINGTGTATAPLPVSNTLIEINDSYIENAIKGVDINTCRLITTNSNYINNSYDLYLRYLSPFPNSIIDNCHFITTGLPLLPPGNKPYSHIIFYNNYAYFNPVHINLCEFDNQEPYTLSNLNDRGNGVTSINTRTEITQSSFRELQYGIRTNSHAVISNSTFNNNNGGALIQSTSAIGSEVHNNTFNVGNNGYITNNPSTINFGVAFKNIISFDVYENNFNDGLVGIVTNINDVVNTSNTNVVHNNNFNNMYAGCLSNGYNGVLYNCNNHNHLHPLTDFGSYFGFEGGDMVIYNGHANTFQQKWDNQGYSTYNSVINNYCTPLPPFNSLKYFNNTTTPYEYLYCDDLGSNPSNISDCVANPGFGQINAHEDGQGNVYYQTVDQFCPNGSINGNKSMSNSFYTSDSLIMVKNYQENVLQSLTDNGNTDQFLASIANLAPNNFTKFYNQLMASSPYLSDTVLIAFMTHPINKPAQKKAVVLANSPLPLNVRPYINQMNVNQNFKNQMWAAQTNNHNAKTTLENYIAWLGNRRQVEINSLAVKCNKDTTGIQADSLINYLENSEILNDRIIRYSLLINKYEYNTAQNELSVINSLTYDLPAIMQMQYSELTNLGEILINTLQLPDSSADSLILSNQAYIENIAGTEFHVAQSDAVALLDKIGLTRDYIVWLPDGGATARSYKANTNNSEISDMCEMLVVYPNPSNGNMIIKYDTGSQEGNVEIKFVSPDGKIINCYKPTETRGEIQVNCNSCTTGIYILALYINDEKQCSNKLNIKK